MTQRKRKGKLTADDQHRRFVDLARELGVDESKAGQEKAFGKVGMKKRKKPAKKRGR